MKHIGSLNITDGRYSQRLEESWRPVDGIINDNGNLYGWYLVHQSVLALVHRLSILHLLCNDPQQKRHSGTQVCLQILEVPLHCQSPSHGVQFEVGSIVTVSKTGNLEGKCNRPCRLTLCPGNIWWVCPVLCLHPQPQCCRQSPQSCCSPVALWLVGRRRRWAECLPHSQHWWWTPGQLHSWSLLCHPPRHSAA